MRIRAVAALLAVSGGLMVPVVASEATTAVAAPVAQIACIHARIGGHRTCIARGQLCNHRYQRQYLSYGLTCVRASRHARYRLQFGQGQQQ